MATIKTAYKLINKRKPFKLSTDSEGKIRISQFIKLMQMIKELKAFSLKVKKFKDAALTKRCKELLAELELKNKELSLQKIKELVCQFNLLTC